MATSKIKKGDTVRVITGKDKGREGKVTAVKDGKVVIDGINQVTKQTHRVVLYSRLLQSMCLT